MKLFRRKRGHDNFTIKKTTQICELNFDISCIKVGYGSSKKSMISGSIPTSLKFKKQKETPKRKSPPKKKCSWKWFDRKWKWIHQLVILWGYWGTAVNDSVDQVIENPEDESELLTKENEILQNSVENLKIEFNNLKFEYMTYRPSSCY